MGILTQLNRFKWHFPKTIVGFGVIALIILIISTSLGIRVWLHAQMPLDGVLVLGGSIRREMYIAETPTLPRPIVISGGSPSYCIQQLFQRHQTNPAQIWLEPCANSTFANFQFAAPLLEQLKVKHLLLITSGSHMARASKLGRIMLGFRGIAIQDYSVSEQGIPANQESGLKTILDLSRGLAWGILSPLLPPKNCPGVVSLATIQDQTIAPVPCESQAGI